MAIIKRYASQATPTKIYNYLTNPEKTEEKLISGINCTPCNMVNEFTATKELYNKQDDIKYHHIVQSFDPNDNITPEKAHELGRELAEKQFKGYEVFVVTHTDKDHIHNHIVVNSVSFENGLKYNASNKSLWDIKRESNRICEREHLSLLDLNRRAKEHLTTGELRMELRGENTWKGELKKCIEFAKEKTNNLEEFQKYLESNFNIDTRVTNKTISYKHPERSKGIRGNKLGTDYDKEELINGFIRKEKSISREGDRGTEEQFRKPSKPPTVDWSAIRANVEDERDGISKQPSNAVTGEIQQKVRGIKERTDRATGEYKESSAEPGGKQQPAKSEHERDTGEIYRKPKSRDFDLDI